MFLSWEQGGSDSDADADNNDDDEDADKKSVKREKWPEIFPDRKLISGVRFFVVSGTSLEETKLIFSFYGSLNSRVQQFIDWYRVANFEQKCYC